MRNSNLARELVLFSSPAVIFFLLLPGPLRAGEDDHEVRLEVRRDGRLRPEDVQLGGVVDPNTGRLQVGSGTAAPSQCRCSGVVVETSYTMGVSRSPSTRANIYFEPLRNTVVAIP